MSEEQRITKVEKEKDPRRVEAGKRLAAISRAAKEKKAERQRMEQIAEEPTEDVCGEGYSTITILTGVGVLSGLVCLYFTYKQVKRATAESQVTEQQAIETPSSQTTPALTSGNKLRSLDD